MKNKDPLSLLKRENHFVCLPYLIFVDNEEYNQNPIHETNHQINGIVNRNLNLFPYNYTRNEQKTLVC